MNDIKSMRENASLAASRGKGSKAHTIIKRSIVIGGHKTSVSLEDGFWEQLKDIAHTRQSNLSQLVAQIDQTRTGNLSSAIRVFILEHLRDKR